LLVACVACPGDQAITADDGGWTLVASYDDGGGAAAFGYVYTRLAGASEGSYTFSPGSTDRCAGVLIEVDGAASLGDLASNAGSTLGVITVPTGGLALACHFAKAVTNSTDSTLSSGSYTELRDTYGTSYQIAIAVAWADLGSGNTNGTDTYGSSDNELVIHLTIDP